MSEKSGNTAHVPTNGYFVFARTIKINCVSIKDDEFIQIKRDQSNSVRARTTNVYTQFVLKYLLSNDFFPVKSIELSPEKKKTLLVYNY